MTTTLDPAAASAHRRWPVWAVSAGAAVLAALATELYGVPFRLAGMHLAAGSIGARTATPVTAGNFAMGVFTCCFWGTVLAVLLARFARRPARSWLVTTLALTVISLAGPALAGHTALSTKLVLGLAHLIAAAIVIPLVARRLAAVPR
jgi:tellurite resistance protein TehA-like permease